MVGADADGDKGVQLQLGGGGRREVAESSVLLVERLFQGFLCKKCSGGRNTVQEGHSMEEADYVAGFSP